MNPIDPTEDASNEEAIRQQTPVSLTYPDASRVQTTETSSVMALFGNTHRDPVRLEAKIRDPLRMRELVSTLYSIVASDYRYIPKDKTVYAAFLRMKRESANLGVWQAQQAYFSWLHRNDPLAAMILDPIITVHPDSVLFEVFSKDESTYATLTIDRQSMDIEGTPICGTTNIDFSQSLFEGIQLMRSYRETKLTIGGGGIHVATSGTSAILEKQIRVPDSWIRGFLQVQSASTLPLDSFTLSPIDFYNVLRYLRMHGDKKGKRRGLRVELIPGDHPRLVLEPWEQVIPSTSAIYKGKSARVIRIWGRRRLLLLRRMLPYIETIDVHLLGSGLPSFWVFRGTGFTLTLGLTGFTSSNWSQALNFDLMLPRKTLDNKGLEQIVDYLGGVWSAPATEISKQTGVKGAALLEALQMGCQQGKLMYDLPHQVFRYRQLIETPLDLGKLEYRNAREKSAYDLLVRRGGVKIVSENRIPGTGLELTGKVAVPEDKREYRPQMLLGDEGQVSKAECTCTLFRKQGLKTGPCTHLIALRLAYAQRETERAKGTDPKQIITVETRSYSRRNESGEEVYQVSLEKERLRVQWGKAGQNLRQQTLQFNTVDEARSAYFARINDLVGKGFLSTTD